MTAGDTARTLEAALPGPLRRVVLGCSYDGTDYHGFADQPGQVTVAGTLLDRLAARIARQPVSIGTAGRTDAGVHARTQVLHVDLPEGVVDRFAEPQSDGSVFGPELPGLARSLTHQLPSTIGVFRAVVAPPGFDARFGAIARRYRYDIATGLRMDPAARATSWQLDKTLDLAAMRVAAEAFIGEHDFTSVARQAPGREGPIVRRVTATEWEDLGGGRLRFEIEARAFAHQMVRSIVGVLAAVGMGRVDPLEVGGIIARADRSGLPTLAPPCGLTLIAVEYPQHLGGRWS